MASSTTNLNSNLNDMVGSTRKADGSSNDVRLLPSTARLDSVCASPLGDASVVCGFRRGHIRRNDITPRFHFHLQFGVVEQAEKEQRKEVKRLRTPDVFCWSVQDMRAFAGRLKRSFPVDYSQHRLPWQRLSRLTRIRNNAAAQKTLELTHTCLRWSLLLALDAPESDIATKVVKAWKPLLGLSVGVGGKALGVLTELDRDRAARLNQYFTPRDAARQLLQWTLQLVGNRETTINSSVTSHPSAQPWCTKDYFFLEPSAGDGRIFSVMPPARRAAVELDARLCNSLRSMQSNADQKEHVMEPCSNSGGSSGDGGGRCRDGRVICADFLHVTLPQLCQAWDVSDTNPPAPSQVIVLGNPPFSHAKAVVTSDDLPAAFIARSLALADSVAMVLPPRYAHAHVVGPRVTAAWSKQASEPAALQQCMTLKVRVVTCPSPHRSFEFCGRWIHKPSVFQLWSVEQRITVASGMGRLDLTWVEEDMYTVFDSSTTPTCPGK